MQFLRFPFHGSLIGQPEAKFSNRSDNLLHTTFKRRNYLEIISRCTDKDELKNILF